MTLSNDPLMTSQFHIRAHTCTQPEIAAKATTEFNIKAVRFSAYEEDQLVTCGRDNVRVYRLKGGQLRGVTVRIGAPDKKVCVSEREREREPGQVGVGEEAVDYGGGRCPSKACLHCHSQPP